MRSIYWFFFVSLFITVSAFAQQGDTVVLKTGTGDIEGTLLIPPGSQQMPVVLLIAGSGPTDRDGNNPFMKNNSLKMLAEGLYQNGIASLRYDKRAIGRSAKAAVHESDLRFEDYIHDAEGWISYLKQMPAFSKVVVAGHSEGALIGSIAAREAKANAFISLAGTGQPADKTIRRQLSAQPAFVLDAAGPILDSLAVGDTVQNVPPMLNALFRKSVQPYLISYFKYDPAKEIVQLNIPVLIIQGTTDLQVEVEDANMLAAAQPKAGLKIMEGMNHILKTAPEDRAANIATYRDPQLTLYPELIPTIVKFINK